MKLPLTALLCLLFIVCLLIWSVDCDKSDKKDKDKNAKGKKPKSGGDNKAPNKFVTPKDKKSDQTKSKDTKEKKTSKSNPQVDDQKPKSAKNLTNIGRRDSNNWTLVAQFNTSQDEIETKRTTDRPPPDPQFVATRCDPLQPSVDQLQNDLRSLRSYVYGIHQPVHVHVYNGQKMYKTKHHPDKQEMSTKTEQGQLRNKSNSKSLIKHDQDKVKFHRHSHGSHHHEHSKHHGSHNHTHHHDHSKHHGSHNHTHHHDHSKRHGSHNHTHHHDHSKHHGSHNHTHQHDHSKRHGSHNHTHHHDHSKHHGSHNHTHHHDHSKRHGSHNHTHHHDHSKRHGNHNHTHHHDHSKPHRGHYTFGHPSDSKRLNNERHHHHRHGYHHYHHGSKRHQDIDLHHRHHQVPEHHRRSRHEDFNIHETHIHLHIQVADKGGKPDHGEHQQKIKDVEPPKENPVYARCDMKSYNSKHNISGTVWLSQQPGDDLKVQVKLQGFFVYQSLDKLELNSSLDDDATTQLHGFHVHEYGDMGQGCISMGGHFNPEGVDHGIRNHNTHGHIGDWGNIEVNKNGESLVNLTFRAATLLGENSIVGRGIVVHAQRDDLGEGDTPASKTTGDAGGRIACCSIVITRPSQ
ncbi:hypothetical protein Btru_054966 [Bulinus truncatus]|nr:hypothetical protein Btru_054966 [Bulinus truncatus]